MKPDDKFFTKIAETYAEIDGEKLKTESNQNEIKTSAKFDQSVFKRIRMLNVQKYTVRFGAAAACILLFAFFYRFNFSAPDNQPLPANDAPSNGIITLSAPLPANFSIAGVEQDRGQTIYHIDNTQNDSVVLTLENIEGEAAHPGLKEMQINNNTAYGLITSDYSVIQFEKENVLYVLTCRYDFNTLVALSESIL